MIMQAIRSGDARAAAGAMESHLERTRIELGTIILMMTGRMSDGRTNGDVGT
jgi:DNA-binding FadR family transcriptional regulator